MKRFFIILLLTFLLKGHFILADNGVRLNIIQDYNNWGWEALVVENGYIELVILPKIGGRVMFYGFPGDEYMAVNESMIKRSFDPDNNSSGPWSGSWGYGGYKNWPAPQDWGWPPPPHLCWGPYSYTIEHNVESDSVVIYLESEVETKLTPGLKQARRFHIYKNSTLVKVDQYLINTASSVKNVAVWDITQAVVQHEKKADYTNFSVYFPASASNITKAWDNTLKIVEVEPGLHKFTYSKVEGKYNIHLYDGWCTFVDERDAQTYVKLFDLVEGETYPDDNSNFEIYSSGGGNYIEIEVLGPQKQIGKDEALRLDEYWYAAQIKGPTRRVNHIGAVKERVFLNTETATIAGEFGMFFTGSMIVSGYNEQGTTLFNSEPVLFEAGNKIVLDQTVTDAEPISYIEVNVYDEGGSLAGAVDTWQKGTGTSSKELLSPPGFEIYPSVCNAHEYLTIKAHNASSQAVDISLYTSTGRLVKTSENAKITSGEVVFRLPGVPEGMYLVGIRTGNYLACRKIFVR